MESKSLLIYRPKLCWVDFVKSLEILDPIDMIAFVGKLIRVVFDTIIRIWGFLKYHHPEVVAGNYNWDYELFRMLPDYLEAGDSKQRDKVLLKWINKYGKIAKREASQTTSESAFIKPDLSWIEKSNTVEVHANTISKPYCGLE